MRMLALLLVMVAVAGLLAGCADVKGASTRVQADQGTIYSGADLGSTTTFQLNNPTGAAKEVQK